MIGEVLTLSSFCPKVWFAHRAT